MDSRLSVTARQPHPGMHQASMQLDELLLPLPWGSAENHLALRLNSGTSYRLICQTEAQARSALKFLESCRDAVMLSQSGGLLTNLSVRDNLLLPDFYHRSQTTSRDTEQHLIELLQASGLNGTRESTAAWLCTMPASLGKLNRRRVGFVRALLSRPETLVFENAFEGLTASEASQVLAWRRMFLRHFPFRTLVFIDLDFNGLPPIDDCHTVVAPGIAS